MNPSGYCGRGSGYTRACSLRGKQRRPGHPTATPWQGHDFSRAVEKGYRQRPLSQRSPQHYPGQARAEQDAIDKAFILLRTNPGRALTAAQVLLDSKGVPPSRCAPIYHLKARALLQLGKIGDCIAFINSLETRVRNDKGFLMTKARALQTKGSFSEALPLFQHLYVNHRLGYKDHKAHALGLGRLLQLMGGADNLDKALAIFIQLRTRTAGGRVNTPCNDKDIELTLGRHLQLMGGADNMAKALDVFTRLRTWHAAGRINTPCNDKDIELTLGRHLALMGGADNMQQALAIFTRLRTWCAVGRINTPCNDKDIELTLGRHLQLMGGTENLAKALAIFTRLRTRMAGGRVNTPCDNKEIELALGRLFQLMGGADNLEKALGIFTWLRRRAAGGQGNTPCDDKDIELGLGSVFQMMGGTDNLEKALAIFTRLRTRAAGGRAHTPCTDKDIELALASFFIKRGNWPEFDALRLEVRHFSGFEPHLCLSVRYFSELLKTPDISPGQSRFLGQAIGSAVLAMEESGFMNASCISQLAHCLRLLSNWPDALLNERGIQPRRVRRFSATAKFLFDTAGMITPCRQQIEKDQHWRAEERALLALLARQQSARGQH